jgi:prephenate dehydrogenase
VAARLERLPDSAVALAGQGLRDVTRIAASDPGLWTQILSGNASAVRALLVDVASDLDQVIAALDDLSGDRTTAVPGDAPGARGILAGVVAAGNAGHARIPGKHGAAPTTYETVRVLIPDEPGQLINIEEFKLDHGLGQSFGLAEVDVLPAASAALAEGLSERGWRIHG